MRSGKYKGLMEELNFEDISVGIIRYDLKETDDIKRLLKEYGMDYEGYERGTVYFRDDKGSRYKIEEDGGNLQIYEIM